MGFRAAEDQIESIERSARDHNLELLSIKDLAIDEILSGDSLINELARKRVDCLVVWRLDCLSPLLRDLEDVVAFIAGLSNANITFISVEDKIDSDDAGSQVLSNLFRAWTELKRNRKIENARKSAIKAQQSGNIHKTGRKKQRDDRRIHELRAAGYSIREIAKEVGFSTTAVQRALKHSSGEQKVVDLDHSPEL
jgi:DNA invertase Pin-like site-specific DNA recombinase